VLEISLILQYILYRFPYFDWP